METEKVNTGETAPDKDFSERVDKIADELQSIAQEDIENRYVLLIAGEGKHATRLLQGHIGRLTSISGQSLAADEEVRYVMLKIILSWLGAIGPRNALGITKALYEAVKQKLKEEESRPKAEA
jgi:hypothetical protein|nr:MAG TPA: hypothetical protein [Caudoviricetes sp.]